MEGCIFCRIVKEEIPCHQIYEDDLVKVFLDVNPVADGHTLVIPKTHYMNIFDVPEKLASHINVICKRMALLCQDKLGAEGVNVLNASGESAQQTVFHLHYHVVPRFKGDKLDLWFHSDSEKKNNVRMVKEKLLE